MPRRDRTTGRAVAAHVLERVLVDGAFAAAALDAELSRNRDLEGRERALATELVYGVLRLRGALESRLRRFAPRKIKDTSTLVHLLIAAYQILVLTRVPGFAAVNSAVQAVRDERGERMAGFANAVLRKLAASAEPLPLAAGIIESTAPWLLERLRAAVGEEEALHLLGVPRDPRPYTTALRVVGDRTPDWLASAERGHVSPRARRMPRGGDLRTYPGYKEGAFVIQDEGSQVIALSLGARAGERILDACSGRGQKTSLFCEQVGSGGRVHAADLHPSKLDALAKELARLSLPEARSSAVDWTQGTADIPDDFDRVLVDAPCSGTGTLWHRPEIALRLGPEDPARIAELATTILRAAATRARPNGRVVFAVCSVLPEEGEGVVDRVSDLLEACPFDAPELASLLDPNATSLRLLPGRHGCDGYFVASFRRRS